MPKKKQKVNQKPVCRWQILLQWFFPLLIIAFFVSQLYYTEKQRKHQIEMLTESDKICYSCGLRNTPFTLSLIHI